MLCTTKAGRLIALSFTRKELLHPFFRYFLIFFPFFSAEVAIFLIIAFTCLLLSGRMARAPVHTFYSSSSSSLGFFYSSYSYSYSSLELDPSSSSDYSSSSATATFPVLAFLITKSAHSALVIEVIVANFSSRVFRE